MNQTDKLQDLLSKASQSLTGAIAELHAANIAIPARLDTAATLLHSARRLLESSRHEPTT